MFRKLFTICLVVILSVATVPQVAAKGEIDNFADGTVNIYSQWGDFETKEEFNQASTIKDDKVVAEDRTILRHVDGGADGSEKAIEAEVVAPNAKDHLLFPFCSTPREGYEVSFYLKHNSKDAKNIKVDFQNRKLDDVVSIPLVGDGKEWTQYTFKWYCDGRSITPNTSRVGAQKGGTTDILIYLDGKQSYKFQLDRLSVMPLGFVEADYIKENFHYNYENKEETAKTRKANFTDIDNHWARPVIKSLANSELVNGMGDGTFAPDSSVTRAEFIKMAYATLKKEAIAYDGRFKDVDADKWYADILASADKEGIIADEIKKDGKIKPNTAITREEAASIAALTAEKLGAKAEKSVSFADKDEISDWANGSVNNAVAYGIIKGYDDGSFKPQNTITRAEAAQILLNLVEIKGVMNIYVDAVSGSDKNNGAMNSPLKTVTAARDLAAKIAPKMQNNIYINIRGEHYFDNTFVLDETHSGNNGYDIVYTSWDSDKAIFTMAKKYTGFELHDVEKNIYKVYVGEGIHSRQAFFNDVRGIRSRTVGYLKNVELASDKLSVTCDNTELLDVKYKKEVDAVFNYLWNMYRYLLDDIVIDDGRVKITFSDYYKDNMVSLNMYSFAIGLNNTPSYLENAYEFLDEKGEWYLNKHDGYMYYIPRDGEDMSTMELKIPIGDNMITAQGSSYKKPLHNVTFDNILFEGTTWVDFDEKGGVASWQNMYRSGTHTGYKSKEDEVMGASMGASLHFEKCNNITLSNNVFRHLGTVEAIEFVDGSKHIDIVGNEFYDISGSSMLIDEASDSGYHTARDEETWCEYIDITNNYIHHVAQDYEGAAAISILWPRHTTISHNEIAYSPYSGVHTGWGWGDYDSTGSLLYDYEISENYIHDIMVQRVNDGAALYSVGASSYECDTTAEAPNDGANKNKILRNYLVNAWNCDLVYPDQESTSWYIAENVADRGPYLKYSTSNFKNFGKSTYNDYWTHCHSSSIYWITYDNNYSTGDYAYKVGYMNQSESRVGDLNIHPDRAWPEEAQEIIANAGISDEYMNNFKTNGPKIFITNNAWQKIQHGVPTDSGLMILGNYNTKFPLSDFDIEFWCEKPGAVTMDENGMVTGHEAGTFECEAYVVVDGVMMHQHFMFEVFEEIVDVKFNRDKINAVKGYTTDLTVIGTTASGETQEITALPGLEVDVRTENSDVAEFVNGEKLTGVTTSLGYATVSDNLSIKGVEKGTTRLVGTIKYIDKVYNVDVPIEVSSHGSKEAESLPYREIDFTKGWDNGEQDGDGFKAVGLPTHNTEYIIDNELVAFDMEIDAGSTWPTIAFCDKLPDKDYTADECYMFGFKRDFIEVQKFIMGNRTMIYGEKIDEVGGGEALAEGGPGPNNAGDEKIIDYKKRYSVIMGALKTEEGTRIILTINGVNIIDYTDKSDTALKPYGYFVSYNPEPGGTTFYPYTGITND